MSNSSLVTYTNLTKNHSGARGHKIDTITIHCIVGQWTAKQGCDYFANTDREASSNYIVGCDGSIGLSVEECNRAWTSSNRDNDARAITIETASDTFHPYAITDKAFDALVDLCADICKRNGIEKLVWSYDKEDRVNHRNGCNMTCHRDFDAKACPGDYIYSLEELIAAKVNAILKADAPKKDEPAPVIEANFVYTVKPGDTLSKIALEYNTTVERLVEDNNIENKNLIYVGDKLKVGTYVVRNEEDLKEDEVYTVKPGDTLYGIARKYDTTYYKIAKDNGIDDPSLIHAGQKLVIKK